MGLNTDISICASLIIIKYLILTEAVLAVREVVVEAVKAVTIIQRKLLYVFVKNKS